MAKAKITMLLDLNEKMFGGKLGKLQKRWEKFEGKVGKGVDKLRDKFGRWADEIPGLGTAFNLIKNPIALATAGILAFGSIAAKGVNAAEKFDSAFLPIRNLNLDKSKGELDSYRSKIRDATFEVGTNLADSTNAMYDLQSATGLYGDDAIDVFKKVGKYSLATGANINDAMNSTTKAMKAFGLELEDIDSLLASNAKTVQTGLTSFDELAKVQTVFGGAAKTAGQDVDVANKMFAVFTSIAGSQSEGATLTKSFFDGLRQNAEKLENTLQIDVFDDKNMMRSADAIMKDISQKFKGMSDKDVGGLINDIGGPEGLQSALGKAAKGADDMIKTFNDFDSSQFSLQKALENAQGDFATMKTMFSNRLEAVFSKFGEKIIPMLAGLFDKLTPVLNWLYENIDSVTYAFRVFASVLGTAKIAMIAFNLVTAVNPIGAMIMAITSLIALIVVAIDKFDSWGSAILLMMGPVGILINGITLIKRHWESIVNAFKSDGIIGALKRIGTVLLDVVMHPLQRILSLIAKIPGMDWAKGASESVEEFRKSMDLVTDAEKPTEETKEIKNKKSGLYNNSLLGTGNGTANPTSGSKLQNDITKVTGAAKQTRNITVTIGALHKGDFNLKGSETNGMTMQDVQDWFNDAMMRVIRNAELS